VISPREEHYVETSSKPVVPFNISTDLKFQDIKLAADEVVIRVVQAGLGKETLKSDVLSWSRSNLFLGSIFVLM